MSGMDDVTQTWLRRAARALSTLSCVEEVCGLNRLRSAPDYKVFHLTLIGGHEYLLLVGPRELILHEPERFAELHSHRLLARAGWLARKTQGVAKLVVEDS